jgi:hypothetical protein
MDFVCNTLESDAGAVASVQRPATPDGVVELRLPPAWIHGLRDIPGYDGDTRTLRLTTDRRRIRDENGRRLGYLGRAHPIVRRALDRVRNLRFGEADAWLDRRVSALQVESERPALLCTFLGVVESARGHEYERVLAVRVDDGGHEEVFEDPEAWLALLEQGSPVATRDLWERAFAVWTDDARAAALNAARVAFARIAAPQLAEHWRLLDAERRELDPWLRARAGALCGPVQPVQVDLFGGTTELPSWKTKIDPADRLAAFATDGANPPAARREADGVLRLFQKRERDLAVRTETRVLEPLPLGLLMLVPVVGGGR